MIKVENGIATRDPIPDFLVGLEPKSLADLSWTDPALGVQDCAWWPEDDQSPALGEFERYADETLTVDAERRVVIVKRAVIPWGADEISTEQDRRRAEQAAAIDAERDRRIDAGFEFEGVSYQSRPTDRENIAGAVLIAAVDPAYTTSWIAADNSVVQMDAAMLLRFGRAVADRKQALIFAGRQLKDMQPIPADYADDRWWP